jgi:hypothetical protein
MPFDAVGALNVLSSQIRDDRSFRLIASAIFAATRFGDVLTQLALSEQWRNRS